MANPPPPPLSLAQLEHAHNKLRERFNAFEHRQLGESVLLAQKISEVTQIINQRYDVIFTEMRKRIDELEAKLGEPHESDS